MQTSILVTGGAGYIGSHTCKRLALAGHKPVVFDDLSTGHRDFVRWGPLVEGDVRDASAVRRACEAHGVSSAIHFAAHALVGESVTDPAKYYSNNVAGTLGLLEGLRAANVHVLVFSSSCAVYGSPAAELIDETTSLNPINPYGVSKLVAERAIADYGRAYGLRWVALRYFNACGADPDGEIGELHANETHLIPRAMMWLLGHLEEFQVFGADYPTPDGTAIRDYIHVDDLAAAHMLALQRLDTGQVSGAFNLGTGHGHSVKEVLKQIASVAGAEIPTIIGQRREGDPPVLVADPARAREQLGFVASHSDIEVIVRTAWEWHNKAHARRR